MNTFFFRVGEMILPEEVGPLLGIRTDPVTSHHGEYRIIFAEGPLNFKHALRGIFGSDDDYNEVTKDGELNLELLWTK